MRGVTFFSLACVWPSVSSYVWEVRHFLAPLITVFYIQLCCEALVTVLPCSHVRHQLKGVYYVWPWMCVRYKGGAVKGSQGHSGLDRKTPGLEAGAEVHHCRQWKALQKAIGLSVILASVVQATPQNSRLIRRHHSCTFALTCLLPVQFLSPCAHPAIFNFNP